MTRGLILEGGAMRGDKIYQKILQGLAFLQF